MEYVVHHDIVDVLDLLRAPKGHVRHPLAI